MNPGVKRCDVAPRVDQYWDFETEGSIYHQCIDRLVTRLQHTRVLGLEEEMATHSSIHSCLENPMDRGVWRAIVHGVAKSQT